MSAVILPLWVIRTIRVARPHKASNLPAIHPPPLLEKRRDYTDLIPKGQFQICPRNKTGRIPHFVEMVIWFRPWFCILVDR